MTPSRSPCQHPGCPAPAAPSCRLCDAHAGRSCLPPAHWPQPAAGSQAPTLDDEIARLAAQRDRVEHWLDQMMAQGTADACEVRRTLAALAQAGRSLAIMLDKHGAGGASELERLFAEAARAVRERAGAEGRAGIAPLTHKAHEE
jgi:hypothetical protein